VWPDSFGSLVSTAARALILFHGCGEHTCARHSGQSLWAFAGSSGHAATATVPPLSTGPAPQCRRRRGTRGRSEPGPAAWSTGTAGPLPVMDLGPAQGGGAGASGTPGGRLQRRATVVRSKADGPWRRSPGRVARPGLQVPSAQLPVRPLSSSCQWPLPLCTLVAAAYCRRGAALSCSFRPGPPRHSGACQLGLAGSVGSRIQS
jgi:hypothetical protein